MWTQLRHARGFTLAEILIVAVIIGIISAAAVPLFSGFLDEKKLDVAAEEVANALRFAVGEAARSGGYVLVDGSSSGHLKVFTSDAAGAQVAALNDPLTKRALDLDTAGAAFSGEVTLTPQFIGGGSARNQLLIGPGTPPLQAFASGASQGALQAGSGVQLTLGAQSATVAISEITGRVTRP